MGPLFPVFLDPFWAGFGTYRKTTPSSCLVQIYNYIERVFVSFAQTEDEFANFELSPRGPPARTTRASLNFHGAELG